MARKSSKDDLVKRLEGSLFAFQLEDHDPEYEGRGLAILKLTGGRLIGYTGYDRYAEELEYKGEEIADQIIRDLKQEGVRKVYSALGAYRDFLGWPLYTEDKTKLDEEGAIDEWREYKGLAIGDELYEKITREGIEVVFVDVREGRLAKILGD